MCTWEVALCSFVYSRSDCLVTYIIACLARSRLKVNVPRPLVIRGVAGLVISGDVIDRRVKFLRGQDEDDKSSPPLVHLRTTRTSPLL